MLNSQYQKQVELLLLVFPEIAKIDAFALHGGTAINLFIKDLPRLSVDIDLTYVPIQDRDTTLAEMARLLGDLEATLMKRFPRLRFNNQSQKGKLIITQGRTQIKIEVNLVKRGCLMPPERKMLCQKAANQFKAFVAVPMVPFGQVYGGKICAALDRQHPRDLFDVKNLLVNEGITESIKEGFLLYLLSASRPIHELLNPSFTDQRKAFDNQFKGMTSEPFSYPEFEETRAVLVQKIHQSLTEADKQRIASFQRLEPCWDTVDFSRFPAIQWKVQNLEHLRTNDPAKFAHQGSELEKVLMGM